MLNNWLPNLLLFSRISLRFNSSPNKNRRPARVWTAARSHRSWRSAAIQTLGWASCSASSACSRTSACAFLSVFLGVLCVCAKPPFRDGGSTVFCFSNKKPACPGGFVRVVDALETKNPGLRSGFASWLSWRAIQISFQFLYRQRE